MSASDRRSPDGREHELARTRAAARPDVTAAEAAWLDDHLAACDACRAAASAFDAQRALFAPARGRMPEPPRDLWARTAASIEQERRPRRTRPRRGFAWSLAPLTAVAVVAIAVGAGLLNGLPLVPPGDAPEATPFALAAGDVEVLSRGADGAFRISRQAVDEVCPIAAERCRPNPNAGEDGTQSALLAGPAAWDAVISPGQDQVVVVERGDGAQGVFVLDVPTPAPAASQPVPATPTVVTPAPTATESGSLAPSPSDSPSAGATSPADASSTPAAPSDPSPSSSAEAGASSEPATTAPPSSEPTSGTVGGDTVGGDTTPESPEATSSATAAAPTETPATTPAPTPSVEVSAATGGAIEIASNVTVVGNAASYSPDGTRFAFSARPSDGSSGPDVYVWRVGDSRARAVTKDHASVLAGWLGSDLLVSRAAGGKARTVILSLASGDQRPAHDGAMWRPMVGPDAEYGVWWDGTVKRSADGSTWLPANGNLVLEPWPGGSSSSQVLAGTGLTDWQVQWDETGRLLAVWTTTGAPREPGVLSLYTIDPETGRADLANPKLDAAPAYAGFSLRKGRLTWAAPGDDGERTVQGLAWKGDTFGRFEISSDGSTTVVR